MKSTHTKEAWKKRFDKKSYKFNVEPDDGELIKSFISTEIDRAVLEERERCYEIAVNTKSVVGRSPLAEEIAAKIKSGVPPQ